MPAAKAANKAVDLYTNADDWEGWAKAREVTVAIANKRGDHKQAAIGAKELAAYYRSAGKAQAMVQNMKAAAKAQLEDCKAGGPTSAAEAMQSAMEAKKIFKSLGDLSGEGKALLLKAE